MKRLVLHIIACFIFAALAAQAFATSTCKKCVVTGSGRTAVSNCVTAEHMETGSTTCTAGWKDNDGEPYVLDCDDAWGLAENGEWYPCSCWSIDYPCANIWTMPRPAECRFPCKGYTSHCHGSPNCATYDPPDEGPASPILINLGRGKWDVSGVDDAVAFNMYGTVGRWTWPRGQLAFLAHDRNGNGTIDSGYEIYGDWTPNPAERRNSNGFAWLHGYDKNEDGFIADDDPVWSDLLLWTDNNPRDGQSQPQELTPIAATGIEWISLDYHFTGRRDQDGNLFRLKALMKIRGRIEPIYDVYFQEAP